MKSKRILTAGIIAAFGLAIMTSTAVYAQSGQKDEAMHSIVQKIAQRFNLKESEVQAVFDAERENRKIEMNKMFETRLTTLVSEGEITDIQKQLILKKHQEMMGNKESKIKINRAELEIWAKDNGIDLQYLMPFGRGEGHFKMKMH